MNVNADFVTCDLCSVDYWWNMPTCEPCSTIDANCDGCSNAGVCTSCDGTWEVEIGGATCVQLPINCDAYNTVTSRTICDDCSDGYYWDGVAMLCADCDTLDPDCGDVTHTGII